MARRFDGLIFNYHSRYSGTGAKARAQATAERLRRDGGKARISRLREEYGGRNGLWYIVWHRR